ncbi:MAG: hypothetical protein ACI8X3_002575, partial [Saprospiraceae bacterium]
SNIFTYLQTHQEALKDFKTIINYPRTRYI